MHVASSALQNASLADIISEMGSSSKLRGCHERDERTVILSAVAALDLVGFGFDELAVVFAWQEAELELYLSEHGEEIGEIQSVMRKKMLWDTDIEHIAYSYLSSLANTSFLFLQDVLTGRTPPKAVRPYRHIGEVPISDRMKAASTIINYAQKSPRDIVEEALLDAPAIHSDEFVNVEEKE